MLTVHGEALRVGRLAIDTGELAIDGAFDALDYTAVSYTHLDVYKRQP